MKTNKIRLLLLIAPLSVYFSAKGDTIVSTFGPNSSYTPCCGWGSLAPVELGYSFVVGSSSDFLFTGAALALSLDIGLNAVDISLAADAGNQPGSILETFHLQQALGPFEADDAPVVVASVLEPLLLSGSQYWLIESPTVSGSVVMWSTDNFADSGEERAVNSGGGSFWDVFTVGNLDLPGAFSISGTPVSNTVTSGVPEIDPGSGMSALALLASALLVIRGGGKSSSERKSA